jgi:anti-sigma B factor antagonist
MQIQEKKFEDILVVKPLTKRIDAAFASEFKNIISDRINSGNVNILLDLSGVDFVDSSGLGAIVYILRALGGRGSLVICGLKETVSTLFRLSRMDKIFRIYASEDEALINFFRENK